MDKYAMYLRKSRADIELEQSGAGETLERHYKILTGLAEKMGLHIEEIYREIVSGESISDRPEMQRLLDDVYMRKYKGVLVMELERLARGAKRDQGIVEEAFTYSNTLIITPMKIYNPSDEMDNDYFSFGLFMSQREYKTIKRRLMTGITESAKEGNFLGSKPPYGYNVVRSSKKDRTLVPNQEESEIVKMIFDWNVNQNMGATKIATKLNRMGIKSPCGTPDWCQSTIKQILRNEVYIGYICWNKRKTVSTYENGILVKKRVKNKTGEGLIKVKGKHEPIISEDVFLQSTEYNRKPHSRSGLQFRNIFAGLMVCKYCGKALVYKVYNTKDGEKRTLNHCTGMNCTQKCHNYDELLEAVIESLKEYIKDFEIKMTDEGLKEEKEKHERNLRMMEQNIMKLESKMKRLYYFLEDGVYSKEEFLDRKKSLEENISTSKDDLKKEKERQFVDYAQKALTFHTVLDSLMDDEIPIENKNALLKGIIERIEYEDINGEAKLDIFLV